MASSQIKRALPANPVNANVTTAQLFALTSNTSVPATVAVPGKLILEQKPFTVRACGTLFTGASLTAKASLVMAATIPGTPFTIGNWTLLGAGTARTVANTGSPWFISAQLQFESTWGTMQGTFSQLIANTLDASAAISNVLSGLNGTNAPVNQAGTVVNQVDPVFYLAAAITFGTGNASNIAYLSELAIDF